VDIRQIQYFVALYEEGSITKAAKRMHVVQPAISQQIKRLEANADVQLFERDPHGVTPNALAHRFYHHCIGVLTELEQARAVLSQGSSHLSGKLVVGSQASFNQYVMGQTLATFHQLCPDVAILARDGYRSDLIEWLIQGELDFALLSTTRDLLNMHTRMVSREDLVVVGHCETLAARDVLKGNELSAFKLILPSRHKSLRNLIDSQFGLHGLTLQPRMEICCSWHFALAGCPLSLQQRSYLSLLEIDSRACNLFNHLYAAVLLPHGQDIRNLPRPYMFSWKCFFPHSRMLLAWK
jgi:LysR family nitrogen assimilation transcriptional regulator